MGMEQSRTFFLVRVDTLEAGQTIATACGNVGTTTLILNERGVSQAYFGCSKLEIASLFGNVEVVMTQIYHALSGEVFVSNIAYTKYAM